MSTATRSTTTHNNTDLSNAFCHCSIGQTHGNLPAEHRQDILCRLLRWQDLELTSDRRGTAIRKTPTTPNGWVTGAQRTLKSYGISSRMEYPEATGLYEHAGPGWLFVSAETFNR